MGCKLNYTVFDVAGQVLGSQEMYLPDVLDWKSIEEKELFIRYIGGLPVGSSYCLISSQGQHKLFFGDMEKSTAYNNKALYDRKMENVENHLEERCRELGIDRTVKPRNQ